MGWAGSSSVGSRRAQWLLKPTLELRDFLLRDAAGWQDPLWSPMSPLACGSASSLAFVSLRLATFSFSKLTHMRRGTLLTQLHFRRHFQVGWNWCWNGVWTWRIKVGADMYVCMCLHRCVCMYTCVFRVMGVVGRTSGWSSVYLNRVASRERRLLLPSSSLLPSSFLDAALLDGWVAVAYDTL